MVHNFALQNFYLDSTHTFLNLLLDYRCLDMVPGKSILVFKLVNFTTGKDPVPIRCPVAGAFNFTQDGDFKFITRYIGGITKDPRHDVWGRTGQFSCKQNISRMAICGMIISTYYTLPPPGRSVAHAIPKVDNLDKKTFAVCLMYLEYAVRALL